MKDVLLTSSVLILAVVLVRALCRRSISRRMQYALWAVVLLRLLIPGNLPAVEFSVLSAARPVETAVTTRVSGLLDTVTPVTPSRPGNEPETPSLPAEPAASDSGSTEPDKSRSVSEILTWVWYGGMAVMTLWLVGTNLRFWLRLRQRRTVYPAENCPYRVYLVERGLSSPCLFGRTVYLTPAAVGDSETLRHVLVHEMTHARHLDPLWSLLRSLCLVIYWFDPLVWLAACLSRQDCELACDEGALKRLGEEQRIAYGRTLLHLIPVRRGGGDLLLSATTMTSDKKRLKERILRIAEGRKPVLAALLLAVLAVAAACAVTFTGCKEQEKAAVAAPAEPAKPETVVMGASAARVLTGGELAWFNETFFRDTVREGDETYINLRNQFLNSVYETPEDIDLYALFYCGLGRSTEEASAAMTGDEPKSPDCPVDKLPRADLDAALLENTGLTLAETNRVGLDGFQYLEAYDAYYHSHGDTNYRTVTIRWGEREGDLLRLYYEGGNGWMCATLEDRGEGQYWFRSNLPCEQPEMPLLLPDEDPVLTVSLAELEPLTPVEAEMVPASGDLAQRGGGVLLGNGTLVRTYLSTDGHTYAAVVHTDATDETWAASRFFTFPDGEGVLYGTSVSGFADLFGFGGVRILYTDGEKPVWDYYAVSEDGQASLLLRASGEDMPALLDLNGDGTKELLTAAGLFFEKDGQLYEADIPALLSALRPEFQSLEGAAWDENYRACRCWGSTASAVFERMVYFDGEQLLVYAILPATEDHVASNVTVQASEVLAAAKGRVQAAYAAFQARADQGYDDWRVSSLSLEQVYTGHGLRVEVYGCGYGFHVSDPDAVMLAGGAYLTEDGWYQGFYLAEGTHLVFLCREDGSRTLLDGGLPGVEWAEGVPYEGALYRTLLENGVVALSDFSGEEQLLMCYVDSVGWLNRVGEYDEAQREAALSAMVRFVRDSGDARAQSRLQQCLDALLAARGSLTAAGEAACEQLLALTEQA